MSRGPHFWSKILFLIIKTIIGFTFEDVFMLYDLPKSQVDLSLVTVTTKKKRLRQSRISSGRWKSRKVANF